MPKQKTPSKQCARRWPKGLPPLSEGQLAEYSTILPPSGRKEYQEWFENRRALLANPDFRKTIVEYREKYPASYWQQQGNLGQRCHEYHKKLFELVHKAIRAHERQYGSSQFTVHMPRVELCSRSEAGQLCQKWGLDKDRDYQWIEWLAQNWNPKTETMPPNEPTELHIQPRFELWCASVESAPHPHKWKPRAITLTLRPGVSLRSAQRGLKEALTRFERKGAKGRPRLSDEDIRELRDLFTQFPLPKIGERKGTIAKVCKCADQQGLAVAHTTIAREYRVWLKDQSQPIKRYFR